MANCFAPDTLLLPQRSRPLLTSNLGQFLNGRGPCGGERLWNDGAIPRDRDTSRQGAFYQGAGDYIF